MRIFLKIGGSLITDKNQPYTAREDMIERIAGEIQRALAADPNLELILGHGSGSFGHIAAKKYNTQEGVHTPQEWQGFVEVRKQAQALHNIVMNAMHEKGLPVVSFPPSAAITTNAHTVVNWNLDPIQQALQAGLLPVIFGDVVFDQSIGGTILSTEDLLGHLADHITLDRILIAGIEAGVWRDADTPYDIIPVLTEQTYQEHLDVIRGSGSTDVTGGMQAKVQILLSIVKKQPSLQAAIFSGKEQDAIYKALRGKEPGTIIR